jgi:hypothetical protein
MYSALCPLGFDRDDTQVIPYVTTAISASPREDRDDTLVISYVSHST